MPFVADDELDIPGQRGVDIGCAARLVYDPRFKRRDHLLK
jgi:hypothetical protein